MNVTLQYVQEKDKSILVHLMELYRYDFSEMSNQDVNNHGLYGYPRLDYYWSEENRAPYLIMVGENITGFVLLRKIMEENKNYYMIAEFFILKKYRKIGIGQRASHEVFDIHKGEWEVPVAKENVKAQEFWNKVIEKYTKNQFAVIFKTHWDGLIYSFSNNER